MSLAEVAEQTGESLSSIKRQSARNPAQIALKVQRLIDGKPAEPAQPERDPIGDLILVHFKLVFIRWNMRETNPELWDKLGEVFNITAPYVEDC